MAYSKSRGRSRPIKTKTVSDGFPTARRQRNRHLSFFFSSRRETCLQINKYIYAGARQAYTYIIITRTRIILRPLLRYIVLLLFVYRVACSNNTTRRFEHVIIIMFRGLACVRRSRFAGRKAFPQRRRRVFMFRACVFAAIHCRDVYVCLGTGCIYSDTVIV